MLIVRNIFLGLVVNMVLFHAVVPHKHHDQMQDGENIVVHENADTIIDFLALGFHLNPDRGHLENYYPSNAQPSEDRDTPFPFLTFIPENFFSTVSIQSQEFFPAETSELFNNSILSAYMLRGPPVQLLFS